MAQKDKFIFSLLTGCPWGMSIVVFGFAYVVLGFGQVSPPRVVVNGKGLNR